VGYDSEVDARTIRVLVGKSRTTVEAVKDAIIGSRTAGEVQDENVGNVYRLEKPDVWFVELDLVEHADLLVNEINSLSKG
jgi:hypothetical protein